jgi:hypothetical protein
MANSWLDAQIIAPDRTVDWTLAGIPGGIPIRQTIYVNVLTTTDPNLKCAGDGVTDDMPHLATALNNCPSNQVVYMPAASYYLGSRYYKANLNGVTLRGDGPGKTILIDNCNAGQLFELGSGVGIGNGFSYYLSANSIFPLASGYTKGSSNLVTMIGMNGPFVLKVGMLVQLSESNDWFVTSYGQNGQNLFSGVTSDGQHCIDQMAQIVAINNGTNITIWPPMNWTYNSSLSPVMYVEDYASQYVPNVPRMDGFENLTITNALGSASQKHVFDMYCPVQCWLTNVEIVNAKNYDGFMDNGLQCQIDHCWFHATGTNFIYYQNYIWETEFSTACLIHNNVFDGFFEGVQIDSGSSGNVVAYNLFTNFFNAMASGADAGRLAPGLSVSHGAYPMMNLVEGNVGMGMQGDFYWGSAGYDTILRNRFTSIDRQWSSYPLTDIIALKIDYGNLWDSIVGNILGSPNVAYSAYQMSGPQGYNYPVIYRLGYPGIDSNGGSVDTNVQYTAIMAGNYDYYNKAVVNPANGIPNSLYLTAKPQWFGSLNWPPFDSGNPSNSSVTNIPAGYRFIFGVDPPAGQGVMPPSGLLALPPPGSSP